MFNLPQIEEKILKFWNENKIFEKSLKKESPNRDYVFYDGPPFATGLPHYGHLVANLMKDIVPRYWTMKGYHIERKWGWDTHGLPIENIVERELKLKNKKDIEKLGVEKFNLLCQSKVLAYAEEWRKIINRFGRWVDMDNDYKTMDLPYMETIWWVFKSLWDKGLIYEDKKSMHICPRCETTLSQSEISQAYLDVEDLSVIAKFELVDEPGTFVLAWTTTPWTLPGNVALAVGKDITYVKIESAGQKYILAKANLAGLMKDKTYRVIQELKGKDLKGQSYQPLFDYFNKPGIKNIANAFKIYTADFVTIEDGTGVVHVAPAFGEDDMNLGNEKNLPFIQHVKMDGRFTPEVKDFAGLEVKPKEDTQATDKKIVKYLADKSLVFGQELYSHSYPHCWRCDTPLLNYTTSSWFVNVTKIKDDLLKNAKNINWMPTHLKEGRFGKWLEGARDWSISRQRFWGSVIPIWKCQVREQKTNSKEQSAGCGEIRVIGSTKELEELTGQKIKDLHKHTIDKITFKCEKCGGRMQRISDVLDCWFESGSMPYAQMHYPFENKALFEANFPAEFIAEGVDQTRAWFYYLHILATALKGSHAYKNVIANGIVLAADGKKMSKKLNNYPDPEIIFKRYGADPIRYYLSASPVMRAEDLNFTESDMVEQGRFFNILLNVLSFYQMFAGKIKIQDFAEEDLENILDRWIIARLEVLKKKVTQKMDKYDLNAVREIPEFINDLSTWYIRRSRARFKSDQQPEKLHALRTLRYVLFNLSKIMAPFMPFTAEHLYQELNGQKESVHLEDWPVVNENYINQKVLDAMSLTRQIVELGLARRAETGIKVRQPLNELRVAGCELQNEYTDLIKDELNVKEIISEKGNGALAVELDTKLTDELKEEGILRELTRTINGMRKKMKLTIEDRVVVEYNSADKTINAVFAKKGGELKKSVLASELKLVDQKLDKIKINDIEVDMKISKI
ncbi:isoleucine--tRNA ligase [Candidatus Kuenenbacteria bacterium CG10_big_fil_rev_8_21_14_0_10_39_14]|uniref:Isoleucine--tRNA ligase n=1 Tax=Candidatus Kuenenbacteria bacterium CG10_big_fil_rev_8_21_14_0_10_39_14 TaxID=1974619 RepID=A0A2H0U7F3_9BACT|nr:MAG: isoleucine--tRNA ligase [Candidatus Kuenenbacteria bacterium CG10_big_fil_rev_8_21_14_0_10_39_14]